MCLFVKTEALVYLRGLLPPQNMRCCFFFLFFFLSQCASKLPPLSLCQRNHLPWCLSFRSTHTHCHEMLWAAGHDSHKNINPPTLDPLQFAYRHNHFTVDAMSSWPSHTCSTKALVKMEFTELSSAFTPLYQYTLQLDPGCLDWQISGSRGL